jgi:hypothetical protein
MALQKIDLLMKNQHLAVVAAKAAPLPARRAPPQAELRHADLDKLQKIFCKAGVYLTELN